MKKLVIALALVVAAALASLALPGLVANHDAQAQQPAKRPWSLSPASSARGFAAPMQREKSTVVWGTVDAMGQFPTLALGDTPTDVTPCGLIREISYLGVFTQTVYGPFIDRLEAAGYREGENLFIFDYDWRLSVLDNAKRLSAFVDEQIPGTGQFDIVAHSMGGLVARTYALNEGGADRIGRMISAGSPWRGSVQVFQLLQSGWGLANALMGGLDGFRRTIVSFPSMYEMMPGYDGCCGDAPSAGGFDPTNAGAWTTLNWTGIDAAALPDLAGVKVRQAELREIFSKPLPVGIEDALVIGVDQRTPQQYDFRTSEREAQLDVRTSWEGDGTVMRDSALLPERVIYPTSFATHDAILSDPSVQDFVLAALQQGPDAALKAVPVRPRSEVLTALGQLVDLVGVAIDTDQPAYPIGAPAKLTVHLRLDVRDAVDFATIKFTVQTPGGTPSVVPLIADPQSSDPTNPLEQSFSAEVTTGAVAGEMTVTVAIEAPDADPRVVNRVVPVVAR